MNETATYQWSEEIAQAAMKAYYKVTIGKPWLMSIAGILMMIGGAVMYKTSEDIPVVGGVMIVMGLIFALKPIRIHFYFKRQAKDAGRLLTDPTVTIELTDETITQSSSASTRTIHWNQLTKVSDVDSFILLWSGKALAASFPSEPFNETQIAFIKSRAQK